MISNINILADRLKGVKVGDKDLTIDMLKDLLSKEESFELKAEKVTFLTDDQVTELKTTVREEQKAISYAEGKTAGEEMFAKELKRMAKVEDKPGKSADAVLKYISEKAASDAGAEPNQKIRELTESLENLRTTVQAKEAEKDAVLKDYETFKNTTVLKTEKLKNIPENLHGIKPEFFLAAAEVAGISAAFDESGNVFPTKGGKPVKDQMEKYRPIKDVFAEFAKENGWINGGEGGSGGSDYKGGSNGSSSFKTMNDVFKYMHEKNIEPYSTAGLKLQADFEAKTQAGD